MKTNKILFGGLAGGLAFFLLGWLVYGVLMMDYMNANYNQCAMKPMEEMVWWALLLSNFASGFMLAFIFSWSNTSGWMAGAKVAGIIGLLMYISFDLSMYSMSTMYKGLDVVFVDILVATVFIAVVGAIIGFVMGMGKKEA
jgi:hypothetical protein